ncbi:MAG: YraN family protein [Candidatus Paceibacterota bacterium]
MFKAHKVGQIGEKLAANFFQRQGFKLVDKNYSRPWGEIDLIVQKGNDLRFVEVKTITVAENVPRGTDFYEPEDNIHPYKLKRLYKVIETYVDQKDISDSIDWQLDAVAVYLSKEGRELKIDWLENIY